MPDALDKLTNITDLTANTHCIDAYPPIRSETYVNADKLGKKRAVLIDTTDRSIISTLKGTCTMEFKLSLNLHLACMEFQMLIR